MPDATKSYFVPPKMLPGFPGAKPGKRKSHRKRWINDDGDILEWDYERGKIERFDSSGKNHKGEFDHETGKQTKPAKADRSVTPTKWTKGRSKMYFYLGKYGKDTDEVFESVYLPKATADSVRRAFALEPDDYPGDCLFIKPEHLEWLSTQIEVEIDLEKFDYSVDVSCDGPDVAD
jgi:hypothetical protein